MTNVLVAALDAPSMVCSPYLPPFARVARVCDTRAVQARDRASIISLSLPPSPLLPSLHPDAVHTPPQQAAAAAGAVWAVPEDVAASDCRAEAKWRTVAAALRLGFDVLSVDPETVFFRCVRRRAHLSSMTPL